MIPELGRSAGEGIGYLLPYSWTSLVAQLVKKSACNAGDLGSVPGLGRSLGEGKGYPPQYSGLENSMDCKVLFSSVAQSCLTLCDPLRPHGLYCPWNSPGQNTGVGSLSLLQQIFPTQESNPGLPHCRRILYQLSYQESQGGDGRTAVLLQLTEDLSGITGSLAQG